jgi:hypothetical protein
MQLIKMDQHNVQQKNRPHLWIIVNKRKRVNALWCFVWRVCADITLRVERNIWRNFICKRNTKRTISFPERANSSIVISITDSFTSVQNNR